MNDPHRDEPPPLLGAWRNLYWAIATYLALIILLFYLFTRTFNR